MTLLTYAPTFLLLSALLCSILPAGCGSHKVVVEKGSDIAVKIYTINGNLTFTKSYCGGIRPSDEQLKQLKTPQAFANRTLFIKQGDKDLARKPAFHSFTTDDNGIYALELPEGVYSIFIEDKTRNYDNQYAKSTGKQGCDQWLQTPNLIWKVKKATKNQTFNIHIPCNPCQEPAR